MAHAQLGEKREARQWYEKANAWMDAHGPTEELQGFRFEAEQLLKSLDLAPQLRRPSSAETQQHLDRKDDARQSLAHANQLADKELSDEAKPPAWPLKLTLQLLRKEAESLIGSADTETSRPTEATLTIVSE